MIKNKAIEFVRPGLVEVKNHEYPKLAKGDRKCEHGVILKVLTTNICGSDLHMFRGKTSADSGIVLGHEITGEVVEKGRDVEFLEEGDIVSVPFNIACGRCKNCKDGKMHVCLNVNTHPGAAYGYVDMGGWAGGQAEYVMCPYADYNLLKFPDPDQAVEKILDLTLLSDIFPTGYHGVIGAGVEPGTTVYIAGAGPVGLCAAISARLRGASAIIVGDENADRLKLAKNAGFETIDLSVKAELADKIEAVLGEPEVDCFVDAVGFEAHHHGQEEAASVLNEAMEVTRAGSSVGIIGVYLKEAKNVPQKETEKGLLTVKLGKGWGKALSMTMGQCPVMRYNRQLMNCILHSDLQLAKTLNVKVISLEEAPERYKEFEKGMAEKLVIDPHRQLATV